MSVCIVGIRWFFFLLYMFSIISKWSKIVCNTFFPFGRINKTFKRTHTHTQTETEKHWRWLRFSRVSPLAPGRESFLDVLAVILANIMQSKAFPLVCVPWHRYILEWSYILSSVEDQVNESTLTPKWTRPSGTLCAIMRHRRWTVSNVNSKCTLIGWDNTLYYKHIQTYICFILTCQKIHQ